MKTRAPAIFLALAAILFFAGIAQLLHLRFTRGDVYPVYSTYRADPLGTRALYESLQLLPGIRAQRWLRDTEKLPKNFQGTLIYAGMRRSRWESMPAAEAERLDALVRGGARVLVAFTAGFTERNKPKTEDEDDEDASDHFDVVRKSPKKDDTPKHMDADEQWDVKLNVYQIRPDKNGRYPAALRSAGAPRALPAKLEWMSELFFEPTPDTPWRTLYTRQTRPVLIERHLGAKGGTLVLAADSFFLSNEALQRARATELLAWLVDAPNGGGLVIFDERHLGLEEDTGIAVLARRYGLAGAALVAALLAALWAWRSMALFVPPAPEPEQAETAYDPTAGLEALLRRSIPRAQLAQASLAEWRKTATAPDIARVERVLAALEKNAPPEKFHQAAQAALRKRPLVALNRPKSI